MGVSVDGSVVRVWRLHANLRWRKSLSGSRADEEADCAKTQGGNAEKPVLKGNTVRRTRAAVTWSFTPFSQAEAPLGSVSVSACLRAAKRDVAACACSDLSRHINPTREIHSKFQTLVVTTGKNQGWFPVCSQAF